jgi:hypothetical protein
MTIMYKRILLAGTIAAGLITIGGPVAAHADRPAIVEQFDEEFTQPHALLTALCGFEITFTLDTRGTLHAWDDGRVQVTERGSFVLANPANGRTLTNDWAGLYKGQATETLNDDGTLTVAIVDRYLGIPERWRDSDGKILIMDRGYAQFDVELVIDLGDPADPDDDELLHQHVAITAHGPHPILEGGGLDPSLACDFLA